MLRPSVMMPKTLPASQRTISRARNVCISAEFPDAGSLLFLSAPVNSLRAHFRNVVPSNAEKNLRNCTF